MINLSGASVERVFTGEGRSDENSILSLGRPTCVQILPLDLGRWRNLGIELCAFIIGNLLPLVCLSTNSFGSEFGWSGHEMFLLLHVLLQLLMIEFFASVDSFSLATLFFQISSSFFFLFEFGCLFATEFVFVEPLVFLL